MPIQAAAASCPHRDLGGWWWWDVIHVPHAECLRLRLSSRHWVGVVASHKLQKQPQLNCSMATNQQLPARGREGWVNEEAKGRQKVWENIFSDLRNQRQCREERCMGDPVYKIPGIAGELSFHHSETVWSRG